MKNYFIAWWNLENLFDVEDSTDRPDYLQSRLRRELAGWTETVLEKKIDQLSSIIKQMNNGKGPDILGVCEVENKPVLNKLVVSIAGLNRNYAVAHHDTSDNRGIDIAFIYDQDLFGFEGQFHYEVLKRSATRDLFQINLRTKNGNPLILIGNHWPARSGGVYESEPYRIMAAETLSYWLERIFEIRGSNIPVIVLGDFNDECFNRSLTDYALSSNSPVRTRNARNPRLYNLMWPSNGQGTGTFYFSNLPYVIDQFMVTRGILLNGSAITLREGDDGTVARVDKFTEMVSGGQYPDPIRFGRPASSTYNPDTGYSDHYPISMIIGEK